MRPIPLQGDFKQVVWPKLNGAVNDMKSMHRMLLTRGFKEADIVELVNSQATAEAILTTIKSQLFDKAKPGDSSLFYFAGHGARIVNKHATLNGGVDVTMVTYDAPKGVPALRNKEMARLYRQVPAGVSLTVIQDNCYSSGGARGVAPPLVTREGPEDSRFVDDPPDPNVKPPDQQDNAVLILAASQPDQKAEELDVTDQPDVTGDSGLPHGRFTFALLRAIRDSLPNDSTAVIFQRTRNYMHSGNSMQEPSMLGTGRAQKGLFGQQAISASAIVPMVKNVSGYSIVLDQGQAAGLREGCELHEVSAAGKPEPNSKLRLQISKLVGLDQSEATVLDGANTDDIHPGDRFAVDKWINFAGAALSVYVPSAAPSLEDLLSLASAVKAVTDPLKLQWVVEPELRVPDTTLRWNGRTWEVRRVKGKTTDLGPKPDPARLAAELKGATGSFFLELPPPSEWLGGLKLGEGTENASVSLNSKSPASAQYMLAGVWNGSQLEYSWLAPNLTKDDLDRQLQHLAQANVPVNLALPLRTKVVKVAAGAAHPPYALTDYALRLAKVRGWLLLDPPAEAAMPFPYHVALKQVSTGAFNTTGTVVEDQSCQIVLRADPKALDTFIEKYKDAPQGVPKSFVYVFVIDNDGSGTLIFPRPEDNGVLNHLPAGQMGAATLTLPPEIPISQTLTITEPFGVDSYMLLTTATALSDPKVLTFDGPGGSRGVGNGGLEDLLGGLGESRGVRIPTPSDWSIQRSFIRSVAK